MGLLRTHEYGAALDNGRHMTLCGKGYYPGEHLKVKGENTEDDVDCKICLKAGATGLGKSEIIAMRPMGSTERTRTRARAQLRLIKGGLYETG